MRLSRVRGPAQPVRRAVLPRGDPVHHLRSRSRVPVPLGRVSLKEIGWFGCGSMMLFLVVLTIGFIYAWKKGALEWD